MHHSSSPRTRASSTIARRLGCARWSVFGLVAVATAGGLAAQSVDHLLYTLYGATPGERFGSALSMLGDVDGDGLSDFAIGAPNAGKNGPLAGQVRVFSGADARVLHLIDGQTAGDQLGFAVGAAGDVDLDGRADFIVGMIGADTGGTDAGRARVYSGRTGQPLFTFDGAATNDWFGYGVGGAGDVNGDGHADLVVGAPMAGPQGPASGLAHVFSGKDGAVLFTFTGSATGDLFGTFVCGVGDVDRDGRPDVAVGAPTVSATVPRGGRVFVFSGRDGKVLHTFTGATPAGELGISVAAAGDVDRDQYPDIVAGAWANGGRGMVFVYSGRDGRVLHTFAGDGPTDSLGWRVAGVGDVDGDGYDDVMSGKGWFASHADAGYTRVWSGRTGNRLRDFRGYQVGGGGDVTGDGVPDLLAGAWTDGSNGFESGGAWVYSGAQLRLVASSHTIPSSTGGTQSLMVRAGAAHAGRTYVIVGSASGVLPGVPLLGHHVPLNPDAYTTALLAAAQPPMFVGFLGTLDANGSAPASIVLPPLPGLLPLTLHHACLVLDPTALHLVTNAVSLRLD